MMTSFKLKCTFLIIQDKDFLQLLGEHQVMSPIIITILICNNVFTQFDVIAREWSWQIFYAGIILRMICTFKELGIMQEL